MLSGEIRAKPQGALIGIGTVGLTIAILDYRRLLRDLWSQDFRDVAGAILLAIVGLATFTAVLTRTGSG
jgi:hypothetical protein